MCSSTGPVIAAQVLSDHLVPVVEVSMANIRLTIQVHPLRRCCCIQVPQVPAILQELCIDVGHWHDREGTSGTRWGRLWQVQVLQGLAQEAGEAGTPWGLAKVARPPRTSSGPPGAAEANPVLLEPTMKVEVTTPEDWMGDVVGDLNRRRGMIEGMEEGNAGLKIVRAQVPLSEMFGYATDLRSATQGRASYSMEFSEYAEVPKNVAEAIIAERG